jgi:ZIP family zinc transporter
MSSQQILILGLIAGATIFVGLPVGRLRSASPRLRGFLGALAVGILLFLLWDVLTGAVEPIESAFKAAARGVGPWSDFVPLGLAGGGGFAVALLGLVAYDRWMAARRARFGPGAAATAELATRALPLGTELALLIALGIGLHNFAEGLAIGQSAAAGELSLALTLVVGFALHNATEGFGIVAPLASQAERPSWSFLAVLGLTAGGPTVIGTLVGQAFVSQTISVLFLGLAGGSILYVVIEMLHVNRMQGMKLLMTAGLLVGFYLGFATDFILGAAGS